MEACVFCEEHWHYLLKTYRIINFVIIQWCWQFVCDLRDYLSNHKHNFEITALTFTYTYLLLYWCCRSTGRLVGNITYGRDPQTYCSDDLQIRPTRAVALTLMPKSRASHRGRPFTQRVLEDLHRACWSGSVVAQVTWPHRREPQPNPLNIHELIAQRPYHIPPCFLRFGHQICPNPSKPVW